MARTQKKRSSSRPAKRAARAVDTSRFVDLAQQAIARVDGRSDEARRLIEPLERFRERNAPPYDPDERLVDYAREHGRLHLEASRRIGETLYGGSVDRQHDFLRPWSDVELEALLAPRLNVFVPDRPGSTAEPSRRYALEWTDQKPDLNEFDPLAKASRWRDQVAIASKSEGRCVSRSSTNGDETDVQAGVGVLFQPSRRRGSLQFRALLLYEPWVSLSADWPPLPPPQPIATAQSYGAIRLVAQSWRATDAGDFRTDALRTIELWNHFVATPDRLTGWNESGIANPGSAGWLDVPADRSRIYALWVILRCWSRSTYSPPSLSSAIVTGLCQVPFMIVEH